MAGEGRAKLLDAWVGAAGDEGRGHSEILRCGRDERIPTGKDVRRAEDQLQASAVQIVGLVGPFSLMML